MAIAPVGLAPSAGHQETLPVEHPLSARELEVLQLIADGLLNKQIANSLFVSEETVKTHIRHLLWKLAAHTRAHAAAIGLRQGIIS